MLDGLGVASAAKPRKGRWIWLLPVLGLGLAAFAWRHQAASSIPSLPPLVSKVKVAEPPVQAPESVAPASVSVAAIDAVPGPVPSRAAVIETPAPAAQPATPASAPVAVPVMKTPQPAAASQPALEVRDVAAAPAARPAAPRQRPVPVVKPAARVEPRAAPAAPPERQPDPDVDLVAALMAHVSTPRSATAAVPAAKPVPKAAPVASRPVRLTIDQRVQRCKAQHADKEDARACRRRVCESHWGRDAACPVRLMARSATTT